jgi:hypothetical protein
MTQPRSRFDDYFDRTIHIWTTLALITALLFFSADQTIGAVGLREF